MQAAVEAWPGRTFAGFFESLDEVGGISRVLVRNGKAVTITP
ncbi:hypothetical protein [Kitasatospora sp. NBC_00240]|nr:hypothetical protein [Kitasatospora sp. NBC_00240]